MEPISQLRHQSLLNSELLGIQAVKLYVLVNGRNAWWGTTSRKYPGSLALGASIEYAKSQAEPRRAQGTWFTVAEVPGLILLGSEGAIGVTDFHPQTPFYGWDGDVSDHLKIGTPLHLISHAFSDDGPWSRRTPDPNSLIQGPLEDEWARNRRNFELIGRIGARSKFRRWVSESHGGGYLLGWYTQDTRDYKVGGATRIRNLFLKANGRTAREAAYEAYWGRMNRADSALAAERYIQAVFGEGAHLLDTADPELALEQIRAILPTLNDREARFITMRLGLAGGEPHSRTCRRRFKTGRFRRLKSERLLAV